MKKIAYIFLIVQTFGWAQSIEIEAKIDTNLAYIGEQIVFELHLQAPKGQKVTWPNITDSLGKLEIIETFAIDTIDKGDWIEFNQKILVSSFDSGYFQIPNLSVGIGENIAFSNELVIRYNEVEVEANKVMDIKDPIEIPYNYAWYILLAIILLLAIIFGFRWLKAKRQNKNSEEVSEEEIFIEPHLQALQALNQLHKDKIWEQAHLTKVYYTQLTEILWRYIQRQFGINTFEKTSPQIINDLEKTALEKTFVQEIETLLTRADIVKFAKGNASAYENEKYLEQVINFVKATIVKPQEDGDE